jgi:adenylate kinase
MIKNQNPRIILDKILNNFLEIKMNIIILGPQGCGKGTQAELIAKKFKLFPLSMGEYLREEIKNKTALGKKIEPIVNSGGLVDPKITDNILVKVSKSKKAKNGLILDGFPRSIEQWGFLKKNFKIDAAIEIKLTEKESIKRISSRRVCSKCGHTYNLITKKPKNFGKCDFDNSKLIQREDDTPKKVKYRLKMYHKRTEPLKKEYKKLGILYSVNGEDKIENIYKNILKILNNI